MLSVVNSISLIIRSVNPKTSPLLNSSGLRNLSRRAFRTKFCASAHSVLFGEPNTLDMNRLLANRPNSLRVGVTMLADSGDCNDLEGGSITATRDFTAIQRDYSVRATRGREHCTRLHAIAALNVCDWWVCASECG